MNKGELEENVEWFRGSDTILCNGALIAVGRNLLGFLSEWIVASTEVEEVRTRCFVPMRSAWIDALCVNQSDMAERASQVGLMGELYRQARRVIAYLGPSDDFRAAGLDSIRRLATLDASAALTARNLEIDHISDEELAQVGLSKPVNGLAVYAILQRSWFRRAWILQEAVLAKHLILYYGNEELDFSILARAVSFLSQSGWWKQIEDDASIRLKYGISKKLYKMLQPSQRDPQQLLHFMPPSVAARGGYCAEIENDRRFDSVTAIESILGMRHELCRQQKLGKETILSYGELFTRFRYLQATDARDKIYAVLGLHSPSAPPSVLRPNYTKSNAFEALYTAATAQAILASGDLDILSSKESDESSRSPKLPSWVPDLSTTEGALHTPMLDKVTSKVWTASANAEIHVRFASQTLVAQGLHVDNIEHAAKYVLEDLTSVLPVIWSVHTGSSSPSPCRKSSSIAPVTHLCTRKQWLKGWQWTVAGNSKFFHTYSLRSGLKIGLSFRSYRPEDNGRSRNQIEPAVLSSRDAAEMWAGTNYRPLTMNVWPTFVDCTPVVEALDVALLTSNQSLRPCSVQLASCNKPTSTIVSSRNAIEVLWRTLVADQYHQVSPAATTMARTYALCISYRMHEMVPVALSADVLYLRSVQQPASEAKIARFKVDRDVDVTALMRNLNLLSVLSAQMPTHPPVRTKFDRRLSQGDIRLPSLVPIEDRDSTSREAIGTRYDHSSGLPDVTKLVDDINRDNETPADGDMKEFWARRDAISTHRRLFSTAKYGYMGNGPDKLRGFDPKKQCPPDEVWVLAGGKVPYVLRPKGNGNYEFLGEAYVHGIMYGEAVKGRENEFVEVTLE